MIDIHNITPNPFVPHVEATRLVDALSDELETTGPQRRAEVERAWEVAYDKRDALDGVFLASPIGILDSVKYRCEQIARIAELDPKSGAAYCRQLADQLEALKLSRFTLR